jgi:phosphatidylethanolamine/phosphatidyl-N-methylethanolamine N-methyltransferase
MPSLSERLLFFALWLKGPTRIGAVAPSGPKLAAAMVRAGGDLSDGLIVELGGGTGPMTRALLAAGVPPERLLVFERDENLAAILEKNVPGVRVLRADAAEVDRVVRDLGYETATAVISSLPLISMPVAVREKIVTASFALLGKRGRYVQFTYGPVSPVPESVLKSLNLGKQRMEWIADNIPPATVWAYGRGEALLQAA